MDLGLVAALLLRVGEGICAEKTKKARTPAQWPSQQGDGGRERRGEGSMSVIGGERERERATEKRDGAVRYFKACAKLTQWTAACVYPWLYAVSEVVELYFIHHRERACP